MNETDRAILEAVAAAEKRLGPFKDTETGVSDEEFGDKLAESPVKIDITYNIPIQLYTDEDEDAPRLRCTRDDIDEPNQKYPKRIRLELI